MPPVVRTFYETITAAIADITEHGFDTEARLAFWIEEIRRSAESSLTPPHVLKEALDGAMRSIYRRMVEQGQIVKHHPGIARFTVERLKPHMRMELDRRIMASAQLIRLNRDQAIETTLRRFSGWATSVPKGGSKVVDKPEVKTNIRKPLASLPFTERRVIIDQSHKFTSALNEVLAKEGNALAGVWHSHYRQAGYDYREDHRERDSHIYAMRGNWAMAKGLMKVGPDGYTDEITQPAEEVYCKCYYTWIYNLRQLPETMLTAKGRDALAKVSVA